MVLPDICHSPALPTQPNFARRPAQRSNIVYITCSTVRGCQGTAHPESCSPIICYMMASHTPHLQCSQPPLKFNNLYLKEYTEFLAKLTHDSGTSAQWIVSKFYLLPNVGQQRGWRAVDYRSYLKYPATLVDQRRATQTVHSCAHFCALTFPFYELTICLTIAWQYSGFLCLFSLW